MEVQIIFVHILLHIRVQYCYYYSKVKSNWPLPLYFSSQWLLATLPSLGRVLLSLHRQSWSLLHCTIITGKLLHTRKAIVRDLYLTHTHLAPASLAFSAPESYFTMHASYLIICPRFTLGVAAVTEKNGGQTDGRTHAHTHTRPVYVRMRINHVTRMGNCRGNGSGMEMEFEWLAPNWVVLDCAVL